jgi:hypothetical protein
MLMAPRGSSSGTTAIPGPSLVAVSIAWVTGNGNLIGVKSFRQTQPFVRVFVPFRIRRNVSKGLTMARELLLCFVLTASAPKLTDWYLPTVRLAQETDFS